METILILLVLYLFFSALTLAVGVKLCAPVVGAVRPGFVDAFLIAGGYVLASIGIAAPVVFFMETNPILLAVAGTLAGVLFGGWYFGSFIKKEDGEGIGWWKGFFLLILSSIVAGVIWTVIGCGIELAFS